MHQHPAVIVNQKGLHVFAQRRVEQDVADAERRLLARSTAGLQRQTPAQQPISVFGRRNAHRGDRRLALGQQIGAAQDVLAFTGLEKPRLADPLVRADRRGAGQHLSVVAQQGQVVEGAEVELNPLHLLFDRRTRRMNLGADALAVGQDVQHRSRSRDTDFNVVGDHVRVVDEVVLHLRGQAVSDFEIAGEQQRRQRHEGRDKQDDAESEPDAMQGDASL